MINLLPQKMTTKMTIAVSLLVALILTATAFVSLSFLQEEFKNAEHKRLSTMVSLLASQVDERTGMAKSMVQGLASVMTVEKLTHPDAARQTLQGRPTALNQLAGGIYIFNAKGRLVAQATTNPDSRPPHDLLQGIIQATLRAGTPQISSPYPHASPTGERQAIVLLSNPTRGTAGQVTGVVVGGLSINAFKFLRSLTDQTIGGDAYVHIFTEDRTIVGHHDQSKLLTTVPPGISPLLDQAVRGENVTGEGMTICGLPALSTFHHLKGTRWVLEVGYPLHQVYAPFNKARTLYLIAGAIITLVAMAATWLVMRYLTSPLHTLSAQMLKMAAQADSLDPLPVVDGGEVGTLTKAFNFLTQQLKSSRNELVDQNSFLNALMDNLPTPVLCKDTNCRIIRCNRAYSHIIQRRLEDILGKSSYDLFPPEDAPTGYATDQEVLASGKTLSYETELALPGGRRHFMVYKAPYLNANREIAGVVVSLLDISERTEAEGNIRAARDFYLTLFEHFPALIWRAGTDARYNYFNQTWLEFTGRPLEQEGGEGWTEGVHAEDLDRCRKTFMTAFRQRHPFTMEYRLRRHDGQYRWLQDMGRPFHDLDGSFAGYIGTCFDITETKGLQQQVIQAQRMEAIGTLTGGIAHDFNNIMTVVQGHANLLQMRVGQDERLLKSVDQILAASERAVALTQSLLLYSRRQVSSPACVNLNDIIREMQELVRGVLQEDISLRFNLDETPMTIMADARQMEQVLMNLLVNARDALPAGGNITISTSLAHLDEEKTGRLQGGVPPGDYCLLTVSDNGKGMDEETRKRIFEPFFTTKEVGKGTGLGLSVVYGIVTQHNGLLDCASRQGAGTDFQVYLPLTAASVSETPVAATATGTTARGEETILLAEDEPMLRQYAREMLEEFGYTVIEAVDGEDALKQFQCQAERIDLLLLDVIMPKINGKSVFEKACLLRPDIKAIFTSGYTAEILGEKNILGPDVNFLSKPVAPDILLQKIREVLDA